MKEEKTNPGLPLPKSDIRSLVQSFLSKSKKLSLIEAQKSESDFSIVQNYDKKRLSISPKNIEKVLEREDQKGDLFLQINFKNGKKVILTEEFIGFAPAACVGLFAKKLPKVVTTADLLNVIDAIEGSVYGSEQYQESLADVKLFFEAIAGGAESIGFDLTGERLWVEKIIPSRLLN